MKRTLILLFALLLLGGVYLVLDGKSDDKTSIRLENRDFISKDKSKINTITLKSPANPLIHLNKKGDNKWYINDKYIASTHIIDNMLGTLSKMKIDYVPTAAENKTAMSRMEQYGIAIKTYDVKGNILTDFVLGPNISTEYGTYCHKAGSSQSYVMNLPIIEGGIRNYFTHSILDLRDLTLMEAPFEKIKSVKIEYPKDSKNSFAITKDGTDLSFNALGSNKAASKEVNKKIVDAYLKDFALLKGEQLRNDHDYRDSIEMRIPFSIISVETDDGQLQTMQIYPYKDMFERGYNTRSVDDLTEQIERHFVLTHKGDFFVAQHRFFRALLKKVDYFY